MGRRQPVRASDTLYRGAELTDLSCTFRQGGPLPGHVPDAGVKSEAGMWGSTVPPLSMENSAGGLKLCLA